MKLGIGNKLLKLSYYQWLLKIKFAFFIEGFNGLQRIIPLIPKSHLIGLLKKYGAQIGKDCDIENGIIFHNCKSLKNFSIGNNCHIGKGCFFDLRDKINISNNVVISMQVTFITHIDMNKSILSKNFPATSKEINISNNVYIGAGSIILKGTNIQENCMIGAASLVNKNIMLKGVYAGVPARLIKNISIK